MDQFLAIYGVCPFHTPEWTEMASRGAELFRILSTKWLTVIHEIYVLKVANTEQVASPDTLVVLCTLGVRRQRCSHLVFISVLCTWLGQFIQQTWFLFVVITCL